MSELNWTTACPDWEERIRASRSLIPFDPLFPEEAAEALEVFKQLRLVDVQGSPTAGECCRQWILDFVAAIFGSYDAETGRRLIRYFLLCIAKKNGKSSTAAGIGLTFLIRNWRFSAEALILAPTIEVASNSFGPARDMVRADPTLDRLLQVIDHQRQIKHRTTGATLKIVAADNETVSGKKASLVIIDELWLFGKRANAGAMLLEATGGLASRPEGAIIYLTTHSDGPPAGVWDEILTEFRGVRDGKIIDPRSLAVIYEYPPDMIKAQAYNDPDTWHLTNPNLGAAVDLQFLLDQRNKAERAGRAALAGFFAKHVNVQIGQSMRADGWAGAEWWPRGADESLRSLPELLRRSEVITVGLDGGGLDDLLGVAVLGREKATKKWLLWSHAFIAPEGEDRRKANATAYQGFIEDGDLTLVESLPDDLLEVVEVVSLVQESGLLAKVGVDAIGLGLIVDELAGIDVTVESGLLVGVRQGISLMDAMITIERKLADGTFKHGGTRLMSWCVGNAIIVRTPTARRLARDEAGFGKIDPLAAALNAAALMATNPEAVGKPYFEEHGLLVLG